MKNFDVDNLSEMTLDEMKEVNGGIFGIDDIIIGLVIGAGVAIINDWDNFKAGLSGQPPIKK